jgi:hypothetical protein
MLLKTKCFFFFAGIMASFYFSTLTIDSIETRLNQKKKQKVSPTSSTSSSGGGGGGGGRHVKWTDQQHSNYTVIKPGIPFKNTADIEHAFEQGLLQDDSHMYLVRHKNYAMMQRNKNVPVYEALYWLSEEERFVLVQKCHLKHMYACMGKTDTKKAFEEELLLPYWVDRFLYSKIKA